MCRNTAAIVVLIFLGIASLGSADDWRPVAGKLMTRWAKDVSPAHPWPEYPRPQMTRPDWTSLNGLWDYAIRPKGEERPAAWDGKILVPFAVESALSGVGKSVSPDERLWYHRSFSSPTRKEGDRVMLHFGAVDWQCTLWINGKQIGQHEGGFDPFSFDITDALHDGENELTIAVWDPTDTGFQPRGKQVLKPERIWYTAVTGIWQTVWLEAVPHHYVKSLKIVPDVDRGVISVDVDASGGDRVRITASHRQSRAQAEEAVGQSIQITLDDPRLWSPDAPNLYDLGVELLEDGRIVDSVESYCGLRKIEVRKDAAGINRLFLNNQPLFQYGPLDQGWWPDGLYTPATEDALKYDIVMTKKLGMNMARKHTKYECDRWYYWCDKLGLLVWQDMPSGNSDGSVRSRTNFRRELLAMVDALHNHPSIVMWVPFNEGWGQHDTPQVVSWLQHYDPARLVNEASGWHDRGSGQVSDMHNYPGPGMRLVEQNRAVVLGEFGGLGMPVPGHTWKDWKDQMNWGYVSYASSQKLTDAYVALLRAMRPLISQGLSAAVYTQTSDVEIEVNGLMTYDREIVKMDVNQIAEAARLLYEPPAAVPPLLAAEPEVLQSNIYVSGQGGYHTYRIPALVVSTRGAILAFCEGRKNGAGDHGNIDLLLKRSTDSGRSWSEQQIVYEEGGDEKNVTIGNPCPVVDRETGTVWVTFCRNNQQVLVARSDDDGQTWSPPRNITDDVKKPDWGWYATGPGNGICLRKGALPGRLLIPCDHASTWPPRQNGFYYSHVIYSDDHGESWRLGGSAGRYNNECAVAELGDGSLMLNARAWDDHRERAIAISHDGGMTWSEVSWEDDLPDPRCQASLVRMADESEELVFSNPADRNERVNMTVRLSLDGGKTWPVARRLHGGPSAYSSLAVTNEGTILCLYEGGSRHPYEWLRMARFSLPWLRQHGVAQ